MNNNAYNIIDKIFNKNIELLQELIGYDSVYDEKTADIVNPFGKIPSDCLNHFLNNAFSHDFSIKNIDNMVGYAEIGPSKKEDGSPSDLIGILAHLDIVPTGDHNKWTYPPLKGEIHENKLYGRGAIDDKGPLIASYIAMQALKESGIKLNKRFRLIAGLDEETGFRCMNRYKETEEIPVFSFSPDANFPAVNAEKGQLNVVLKRFLTNEGLEPIRIQGLTCGERANIVPDVAHAYFSGSIYSLKRTIEEMNLDYIEVDFFEDEFLKVTAYGKAAHAMHPEKGINAMHRLINLIADIELDYGPWELKAWIKDVSEKLDNQTNGKNFNMNISDDISGDLTLNLGILRYRGEDLTIKYDIRYPVTKDPQEMEELVENLAGGLGMLYKITKHLPPLYIEEGSPYLNSLLKAYRDNTSDLSKPLSIGGRTYSTLFPNALSFGAVFPGENEIAHQADEYIDLEKMKLATKIYLDALINLNEL